MSANPIVEQVESYLRDQAEAMTEPTATECLGCYVQRMLAAHGCNTTLRWARRFRDRRSPRATGLERRLEDLGGFCDCEIFLNGYQLARHLLVRNPATDELGGPAERPDCAGVRPTSTRPCSNWERRQRW